jgi:(1->4)-alpha-D-glucan 1-alpha-D-glucosylmutase
MPEGGGIRIDHVMWICRQFWIAEGASPDQGAYVMFPKSELLAILRLISVKKRCLVLGEDLGTVPPGFRRWLRKSGIYTMHVVRFERLKNGDFRPLEKLDRQSALFLSTHDLAPFAAHWSGLDIELMSTLNLLPSDQVSKNKIARKRENMLLAEMLERDRKCCSGDVSAAAMLQRIRNASLRSPCPIIVDSLDDLLLETTPVNIPGTTIEYPNWRRKYRDFVNVAALEARPGASTEPGNTNASRRSRKHRH